MFWLYFEIVEKYDGSFVLGVIGLAGADVDEAFVELLAKEADFIIPATRLTKSQVPALQI